MNHGDEPSGDGGWFGRWSTDEDGLACLDLDPSPWRTHPAGLVVADRGFEDCWHQVAGPDIAATAHVGGWTTVWEGRRGMVRLTGRRSWWGHPEDPVGWWGRRPRGIRWGRGYAQWDARSGPWRITRRVTAVPCATPLLQVRVRLSLAERPPDPTAPLHYAEAWVPEPLALLTGALMSRRTPPPPELQGADALLWEAVFATSAVSRRLTDAARGLVSGLLQHPPSFRGDQRAVCTEPRWPRRRDDPVDPGFLDLRLPAVAVALAGTTADPAEVRVHARGPALVVELPAGTTTATLELAVALTDEEHPLDQALAAASEPARRREVDRQRGLLPLELPEEPVLAREAGWHATYLTGCLQRDDAFGVRYPSQGSAYGFVHGLQGAPRDYAISAAVLAAIDPPGAADALRSIMAMTDRTGTIHYAHTGRGHLTGSAVHPAPTDLPLFFLWALAEYLERTGDTAFLDERVPHHPRRVRGHRDPDRASGAPTVVERAVQALEHLAERVGTGPHGMLRVGSGDWADPISAMVGDRGAFHRRGESGFNTTMACHVLPLAAEIVGRRSPETRADTLALSTSLREAMDEAWTGSWFLRGWDGTGGPLGDRHLFLDGQVWALIARIGDDARRARLVEEVRHRCMAPSPIGATILDRPHPVRLAMLAPGWDCNGGVWAALNGLLAWGLAGHDPDLAWESLRRQSLAAHARAYPWVWFGIWSGPDAYNAAFGSRPGETFVQPATPMQEHPVMNSNAHAGPLLGLLKVLGHGHRPPPR